VLGGSKPGAFEVDLVSEMGTRTAAHWGRAAGAQGNIRGRRTGLRVQEARRIWR